MIGSASNVQYKQVTQAAASTLKSTTGDFFGYTINSSTSGTVTVYDGTSTSGTVVFTKSVSAGDVVHFGGVGIRCGNGIHVVVGGTATVNALFQ
jgi:hypothetical protein